MRGDNTINFINILKLNPALVGKGKKILTVTKMCSKFVIKTEKTCGKINFGYSLLKGVFKKVKTVFVVQSSGSHIKVGT